MERGTFPHIDETLRKFVIAELWTTGGDHENAGELRELMVELLGQDGLPQYAVVDTRGGQWTVLRNWAYERRFIDDPRSFATLLEEGLRVFQARSSD